MCPCFSCGLIPACCADTLCAVLERDTLGIRESRLFGAVGRWADAECHRQQLPLTSENKQKVLGKALTLIRFPLMTVEEFAAGKLEHSGLLGGKSGVDSVQKGENFLPVH